MNRRRQIQLTPDEQEAFLREHRKAALATIDQNGFPHLVAMNFLTKDGAFYMTSYSKAQKVLNVRRNPKVALMVETGNNYGELCGVVIIVEMYRVDALVHQYWSGVIGSWIGRHDDPGHGSLPC